MPRLFHFLLPVALLPWAAAQQEDAATDTTEPRPPDPSTLPLHYRYPIESPQRQAANYTADRPQLDLSYLLKLMEQRGK